MVQRAQAVELPTEVLLAQIYKPAKTFANEALPVVCGVMGGAACFYLDGLAAAAGILPSGAVTAVMQGTAAIFGAAAGVFVARVFPSIRRITSGEGDVAQQKVTIAGMIERLRIATSFTSMNADAVPGDVKDQVLKIAIDPKLLSRPDAVWKKRPPPEPAPELVKPNPSSASGRS